MSRIAGIALRPFSSGVEGQVRRGQQLDLAPERAKELIRRGLFYPLAEVQPPPPRPPRPTHAPKLAASAPQVSPQASAPAPSPPRPATSWFPDWKGQTCVIVASGPSASGVDLAPARSARAKFMTINASYKLAPWSDVAYACDAAWWKVNAGLPQFGGLKICREDKRLKLLFPDMKFVKSRHGTDRFLFDRPGEIGWGGNSGFGAINIAAQFGPAKLILVGFDMRLDKGMHWHGKHGNGLHNPTDKNVQRWRRAIDAGAPDLEKRGIKVLNCSPISALTAFPKMTLQEALIA